jgi:hypothetical protein
MKNDIGQLDREQAKTNNAAAAKELQDNAFFSQMMVVLKGSYIEKLTRIKKGKHYEAQLKDVHDSLQNLSRIEGYIEKCIIDGRFVEEKRNKLKLFNKAS